MKRKKTLIHLPFNKVKGRMRELNISQEALSKELNMSISTMNEKLNGYADFKFTELVKMSNVLRIDQSKYYEYFFQYGLRKRNK